MENNNEILAAIDTTNEHVSIAGMLFTNELKDTKSLTVKDALYIGYVQGFMQAVDCSLMNPQEFEAIQAEYEAKQESTDE